MTSSMCNFVSLSPLLDDKGQSDMEWSRGRSEHMVTSSQASLAVRESGLASGARIDRASSLAALSQLEDEIKVD